MGRPRRLGDSPRRFRDPSAALLDASHGSRLKKRLELEDPPSMEIWVYRFVHLFSGLRRPRDIEHYLLRIGGDLGVLVVIESYDAAYGDQYDLDCADSVQELINRACRGEIDGCMDGAPCSTWSRARFRPGGPPPLHEGPPASVGQAGAQPQGQKPLRPILTID